MALERRHRVPAGGLGGVGHGDDAQQGRVLGEEQRRLPLRGQSLGAVQPVDEIDARLLHHGPASGEAGVPPQHRPHAPPVDGLEALHRLLGQLAL